MASESDAETSETNLSDLFDNGFELFNNIMKTDEATNSLKVQLDVKKCMSMLENATRLVSLADMFSTNEEFDEVPTESIKYFLLPALLGTLTTKLCDRDNRKHYVNVTEVYFYDFLERIKAYGIIDIEIPKRKQESEQDESKQAQNKSSSNTAMIEDMVNIRALKIQRFKDQKELKDQLEILQKSIDNPNIDDESKRKYFTTLIKSYALQAIDEIASLAEEKKILKQMESMKREDQPVDKKKEHKAPKLQPIIITRNLAQKQVFGAGYPSLPVMTVEEFYEKKVADGEWAPGGPGQTAFGGQSLQDMANNQETGEEDPETLKKEELIEKDDEDYRAQLRDMDEYKDTHKRGWGNRYNRS